MESYRDRWTYLVALALPPTHARSAQLLPPGKGEARAGLAHVLVLDAAPVDTAAAPRFSGTTTLGQVVGDSRLRAGRFALYPITKLATCDAARVR
jgi:hypothetical protein